MDVCREPGSLCSLAQPAEARTALEAELSAAYPAIRCDATPDEEPTCVPRPPGQNGRLTAEDQDGDELVGAEHPSPSVFPPIRLMDTGAQRDWSGDGTGDACDAPPIGADHDEDQVADEAGGCPLDSGIGQEDSDRDGKERQAGTGGRSRGNAPLAR